MKESNQIDIDLSRIAQSTLFVKCSGVELEQQIQQDLTLPDGKSIAELLYDQKETESKFKQ